MARLRLHVGCVAVLLASAAVAQAGDGFGRDHGEPGTPGRETALEVSPALTRYPGIDACQMPADIGSNRHYIARPRVTQGRLLVMLGGSDAAPTRYRALIDEAARTGLDAISLSYANDDIIALRCSEDACYESLRGEVAFGRDVHYSPLSRAYASDATTRGVPIEDSIVMRLVALLDYLARTDDVRWRRYLRTDFGSPYVRPGNGLPAYPDWSHIVLAGHSQGGGEAAFMAMHLPHAVARVLLFSSPQDSVSQAGVLRPARWLMHPSRTPMSRWFGLRHAPGLQPTSDSDEGPLGDRVNANWRVLGGSGLPGADNGDDQPFTEVFTAERPQHRLFISLPSGINALKHHNSTAVDDAYARLAVPVWHYLLRAYWPGQWFDVQPEGARGPDRSDADEDDEAPSVLETVLPDLPTLLSADEPAAAALTSPAIP